MRLLLAFVVIGLFTSNPSLADPDGAPRLERISFAKSADGNSRLLRFHMTGRVTAFSDPRADSQGELEILLYNVKQASDFQAEQPQSPVVSYHTDAIRGHLKVLVKVDGSVMSDVFRDGNSDDLFLALAPAGRSPRVAAAIASPTSLSSRNDEPVGQAAAIPQVRKQQAALNPGSGERSGDAGQTAPGNPEADADPDIAKAASRWKFDRIVIDAGHGGHDPGAIGAGRIREKDVVLPVALKLGEYLKSNLGVEVIYTRDKDTFITLRDRGRTANQVQADLFVSIHANSAANPAAHGTETYFLGMNKESAAQKVIERENAVIQLEQDQSHYQDLDQATLVKFQLAQSAFLRKSEELAARIEHQFSDRVGRKSRGVKEGNLQVLWAAATPAVLVELGFVSNPEEARFMTSEQGASYLASAIFRAIRDYKEAYETSLSLVSDR